MGNCVGLNTQISVDQGECKFFHGRLKVHVIEAGNLPDTDTVFFNIDRDDFTDPFVTLEVGTTRLLKTKYISNCLNPKWDEKFNLNVCHPASTFDFKIRDKEHVGSVSVGQASVKAEDLISGEMFEGDLNLTNADGENIDAQIKVSIQYIPKEELEEEMHELEDSYFPVRESCRMIMYQDADTPNLPQFEGVTNPDQSQYEPTRAWRDLYECIKNAQKFIYITGWSVFTNIQLLRGDEDPDGFSHVGELLKAKAEEGVKVLMLVWNEKGNSTDLYAGLMGTHDEDTKNYFEGSKVNCVLVSRGRTDGVIMDKFEETAYTHHQKTVICDADFESDENLRQIVAFIGGLDITDGRYDSPEFNLFKTIKTLHQGDFYSSFQQYFTNQPGSKNRMS